MNIAIILAGGTGSRLGADRPKQFIEIQGKPIIVYTIGKFQNHPDIDAIEVVCIKSWQSYLKKQIEIFHLDKVRWIVDGGETFSESTYNGFMNLDGKISDNDIVMTHFAASPFVEPDIITDVIRVCKEHDTAISTTPFYLLSGIKENLNSEFSSEYISRDTIACMNSPHAFRYSLAKKIYKDAIETGIIHKVEPHTSTLMYKMGYKLWFSHGSQCNIKITTKDELSLFEGYVLMKKNHGDDI